MVDRLRGMPAIQELRAAVIWVKGVSTYVPDGVALGMFFSSMI